MARKRPKINLSQPVPPQSGDLESLFSTPEDTEQASGMQLLAIRVDAIQPDPYQPRRTFPEDGLAELSKSIEQDGVIQPIEVTEVQPNVYLIVHGERRWRAAQLAGLETIPAVVRRRDYDEVTRFVRQLVENIQREDLNDVDRAAGLVRLRDLMQEELDQTPTDELPTDEPWSKQVTWAKVGKRLGYSRQRIHQLIKLLNLPDEIKEAVRAGQISERDTRVYQGLRPSQQRALHQAQTAGELSSAEIKQVATYLKKYPDDTVAAAIRLLRQPPTPAPPTPLPRQIPEAEADEGEDLSGKRPLRTVEWGESGQVVPPRAGAPTSIDRLDWIRGHLSRVQREGLSTAEKREMLRLLYLIQQDVASLIDTLQTGTSD